MWCFWLIAAGVFFVVEIITVGFLVFWLGIGALLAMVASIFTDSIAIQTSVFVISSAILIPLTKPLADKFINKKQKERENSLNPKKYFQIIGTALYNETKKSKEERSKDIFALVLTIIIVAIIVFIFWKVPVLNKFLFP